MKNLLTKTLFISLLLSATIPSGIQAGLTFNAKESLVKAWSDLADFRTSFKETTVGLSKQAREKAWKILNSSDRFQADVKKVTVDFLNQFKGRLEYDFFKYAVATVGIVGVLCGLNYKFDLAARVEEKRKGAWNNKWVRYSTYGVGTTLALTALYSELVHKGYLPEFSAVKSCLIFAWQEKNLGVAMLAYQSIPREMRTAKAVGREATKAAILLKAEAQKVQQNEMQK